MTSYDVLKAAILDGFRHPGFHFFLVREKNGINKHKIFPLQANDVKVTEVNVKKYS